MNLVQFLIYFSDHALADPSKYIQPGHNGQYNDPETPVRNYGHWLITYSKCFELTGKQIYLNKIKELAEYLISDDARPYGYSFHHRSKESKDKCNGLIGQAWTFESLACASIVLNESKYVEVAEEVFFQHQYDYGLGLWNRLEIDGTILSIDPTFNHQLWFAASASLLNSPRKKEITERIFRFLDLLSDNLSILNNGLIYHPIVNQIHGNKLKFSRIFNIKRTINNLFHILGIRNGENYEGIKETRERMIYKSIGYHQFNMYAFAMLEETLPDHKFWESTEFNKSVDYLLSDEFKNGISNNIYGFPYNPPGFEVPYALSVLTDMSENDLVKISSWWVNQQFIRCYNAKTRLMDRNTEDPLTHTARIYELTKFTTSILQRIQVPI